MILQNISTKHWLVCACEENYPKLRRKLSERIKKNSNSQGPGEVNEEDLDTIIVNN